MRHILVAVALVLFAGVSNAQSSPPTAAHLNANFDFVMKAIDANAKAIAARATLDRAWISYLANQSRITEMRVSKLEGQITAEDLVDIYAFSGLQTGWLVSSEGVGQVEAISYSSTLELQTLRAFSRETTENTHDMVWTFTLSSDPAIPAKLIASPLSPTHRFEITRGTWSMFGSTVTLKFGGTPVQFSGTAGGRILVATSFNDADASNILLILVRQN